MAGDAVSFTDAAKLGAAKLDVAGHGSKRRTAAR